MSNGWNKRTVTDSLGIEREAQAPVIVSASRSTDIPAFYAQWFFDRLRKGYSVWTNPFNGVKSHISYADTRFIVFWSKNPEPLLPHLGYLEERGIGCYIQYTLNDYGTLESGVPPLDRRIDTFMRLSDRLGKDAVIWRFDPLILTQEITRDALLEKMHRIAMRIKDHTSKLVFSFADIAPYRKVSQNLQKSGIRYVEWTEEQMLMMAKDISEANSRDWHLQVATCGESINLGQYGIEHNRCIDDRLIARLAYRDRKLMDYLGMEIQEFTPDLFGESTSPSPDSIALAPGLYATPTRDNTDKGQRTYCGCSRAKDIGNYNTCPHLCEYCYANTTKATALANWNRHRANPDSESII